jgi:putative ABC transport system substrate-binding protein
MIGRREFITLLSGAAAAWPLAVRAQQPAPSAARIGWLKIQGPRHSPDQLQAFQEGMRALGLVEGRDYLLEQRYADGHESELPALTAELLGTGVRVIVATSQPSIIAAARVTKAVPIIGRMVDDPATTGLARSLARPGGNITGVYTMTEEMNPKRLDLLKEAVPSIRRVGVLLRDDFPNVEDAEHSWEVALAAARKLELELQALNVRSADDLTEAFEQATARKVGGIMTFRNPTVVTYLKLIAELCRKYRLPTVFDAREYVEAGGLMSYGADIDATYRQLATYVDKILHGARPGELPIEQPTAFELVINKHAADTIGIALPPMLLATADKVIE